MELWDLYDACRRPLGITHQRGGEVASAPPGTYHLCVHTWIKNGTGQYLMSRRSPSRKNYPLKWECQGGSVIAGENSLEGALREVHEEIGVTLDPAKGKVLFSKVREKFHDIMDVWLFDYDGEASLEDAETEEVCETAWMTRGQIKELFDAGELVGTLDYFFCAFGRPEPDYSGIIGKRVSGYIDRPMGSAHPRHPDMIYPVNYGWAEGYTGGDGQPQDVYYIGPDKPVERFEGTVIAVLHRFDDVEDKWIVTDGRQLTDNEILGLTAFQEQYFYAKLYR